MSNRQKPGLRMKETLWGYFSEGIDDFEEGYKKGEKCNNRLQFWVNIDIESFEDFIKISSRKAKMTGKVSCPSLGKNLKIKNGEFNLFQPDGVTGERRINYTFSFTGRDGKDYYLDGYKIIYDDPGKIDLFEDMTTLFTRIYRETPTGGEILGSGILIYHISDLPAMIDSMKVTNCKSFIDRLRIRSQYFSFAYGELRNTYFEDVSPFYFTAYENFVLNGHLSFGDELKSFFFFSGIHDKGFPWGDKAAFWDIALLIRESDNNWRRYVLSNHRIENLILDVEKGIYTYEGDILEISTGFQAAFSQMRKTSLPAHLEKVKARINIQFRAEPFPGQNIPFVLRSNYKKLVGRRFAEDIRKWLPHFETLGMHLIPHKITIEQGEITLKKGSQESTFKVDTNSTLGEAEISSFKNIRKPTLYYNYFCTSDPTQDSLRLHVRTDVLREDRKDFIADKIEEQLGKIVDQIAWLDLEIKGDSFHLLPREEGDKFPLPENVLLEVNNNHYPTAVFQRRIVELQNATGKSYLALEENMDILNLGSIDCDRTVTVAVVKDPDKFRAFRKVIEMTDFFGKLNSAWQKSGKDKKDFAIIIKPSFMFMYSLKDPSTFTDPELVESLITQIYREGYRNISVAEARSTYGTFFTNREVKTVANYIGLDGVGPEGEPYKIIDLSLDLEDYEFSGKLGKHSVNTAWKNADFRISFAKNKTHSYAYYTLTIKNIYGALPQENKFKEYHCERDIFSTTIEYLKHFPVHFGFIDAHISADGPFGIFADKDPNYTETIIGGEDLVAVDWIGAAKMGLDPMVSEYMQLAVKAFRKPEIHMLGDRTLYPDWVNVPDIISKMAFGLDKEYYFGNLFYSVFATMDPYFEYKERSIVHRIIRVVNDPIRSLFFERMRQGVVDVELNKRLYDLFTGIIH
jgi:uncharacterized protein (DUF362 family)